MNINLTENEIKFLKQYAEVYDEEREIDITRDPIVVVENTIRKSCGEDYSEGYIYLVHDEDDYFELETIDELENWIQENGFSKKIINETTKRLDWENKINIDGTSIEIIKFYYQTIHKPVAYFLTRKVIT